MKQVLISGGSVRLEEVPAPRVESGTLLIRMDHSCISIGTEMSGVRATGRSIWERALQQPKHVKKVIDMLRSDGLRQTRRIVQERLAVELPTGYSGAGVVVEAGGGVREYAPGDRVACAGAQCAFHAEIVCVPKNLVVPVPQSVELNEASTVALGAIAMQGVRRAAPTLGETFVVIGLGILGQLTVQMLKANGCRVVGVDLDRNRIEFARSKGMNWGIHPDEVDDVQHVARLTGGVGADGVIITAAGQSDTIVSAAFRMCRKKARVVLVGDVGLDLQRADFYAKELDFLISTSYGPGRYDANYEEAGLDYPLGYVRWTEGRNMAEYLNLISDGILDVRSMIDAIYPISDAELAYQSLKSGVNKPLIVLLSYSHRKEAEDRLIYLPVRRASPREGRIRIALVGAGGFAKGMHLPNIRDLKNDFTLQAVVSRTGSNATATGKRFGAKYSTTDYQAVLADTDVDAVIIATHHHNHAQLALESLRAGKHVLVEKPLALEDSELKAIEAFYAEEGLAKPVLLTGFNRRFSPYAQRIGSLIKSRTNPIIISYRMNAGYIPLDHWVHGPEGGGRNRGEACHIYDLFGFLTGSAVKSIQAASLKPATDFYLANDNFVVTIQFEDGSVATLTYTALGNSTFPKEMMEIFVDGMVISLNDYRSLNVTGAKYKPFETRAADKGQMGELQAFASAIRGQTPWPIPLWQQMQTTWIACEVERLINQV